MCKLKKRMSNVIDLPPNDESGLYHAPSHENGGVQVVVNGGSVVEVEGGEIHLCRAAMQSDEVLEYKDMTNKEILDALFQYNNCVFEQGKAEPKDFIICKLVVDDKKKRTIKGTVKQIVNKLQEEKACNVTEDYAERVSRQGGKLTTDEEARIRLDVLKRMQKKKPSKQNAEKIRELSKKIRSGYFKNGGVMEEEVIEKKEEVVPEYKHELLAVHNLSYPNLLFADKLGGISMPSIAIIRINNPILKFGEITLVAPKSLIDPKKNSQAKIYNRDVYSPSYPLMYSHVDKSALRRLESDLYAKRGEWTEYEKEATNDISSFIEMIENGKHIPEVIDKSLRNFFVVYSWARDTGVEIEIPVEDYSIQFWSLNPETKEQFIELIKKYPELYEAAKKDVFDFSDKNLKKQLADAFRENYIQKFESETDEELKHFLQGDLESYFDEEGELNYNIEYTVFKNLVLAIGSKKRVDYSKLRDKIETLSNQNQHSIREYVNKMIDRVMSGSYFFRTKSKKAETTIDNIYDYMMSKSLKAGQKTMVFGLGNAAALGAKEYDSLIAVARDKDSYTVTESEFDKYKEQQQESWNKVLASVRKYYKYDEEISFDALDNLSKAMGLISKYKNPTDEKIAQILARNNYGNTPSHVYDDIREFVKVLREAPAQYFEVKITDVVRIEAFIGAAVPHEVFEDASIILKKHGITNIVAYDRKDYENKESNLAEALEKVVSKTKTTVMFKKGGATNVEPTEDKKLIGMHLPVELSVYVPSTKDANVPVSKNELDARVNEVREYLAKMFGGFSSNDVIGGYVSHSKELIKEDVVKVIAFATQEAYDENKEKLAHQIAKWAKEWSQEAIGFELEGDLYYINQEATMRDGGIVDYKDYEWTMKDFTEEQISKLRKLEKTAKNYFYKGNKIGSKLLSEQQHRWFKEAMKLGIVKPSYGEPLSTDQVMYSVNGEQFDYYFYDALA